MKTTPATNQSAVPKKVTVPLVWVQDYAFLFGISRARGLVPDAMVTMVKTEAIQLGLGDVFAQSMEHGMRAVGPVVAPVA